MMKHFGYVAFISVLFVLSSTGRALSVNEEWEKELQECHSEMEEYQKELSSKKSDLNDRVKELIEQQKALNKEYVVDLQERLKDFYAEAPNIYSDRPGIPIPPFAPDSNGKRRSKSRLMVMYRLVDQLNLDEETATKFFPAYLEYVNSRDKLVKEHRELIHRIAEDADDESVSIKDLRENIAKLRKNETLMNDERDAFLEKSETILDERQCIKLIVFNDKLKEDLFIRFRSERLKRGTSGAVEDARKTHEKAIKDKNNALQKAKEKE